MLTSSADKFGMLIGESVRKESKKDALLKTREFGTKRRRSSVFVYFSLGEFCADFAYQWSTHSYQKEPLAGRKRKDTSISTTHGKSSSIIHPLPLPVPQAVNVLPQLGGAPGPALHLTIRMPTDHCVNTESFRIVKSRFIE